MLAFKKSSIIISLAILGLVSIISCTTEPPDPINEPPTNHYIEKGKIIVKGLAACGFCHGESNNPLSLLSGGRILHDKYGEVTVPNITPSENGIKDWSTLQLIKFFRSAQKPDEAYIAWKFHKGMEWMSDDDILSIISYLQNMPAVKNDVEPRSLSIVEKNTIGFFEAEKYVTGYVPDIDKSYQLEYGKYLVDQVARCGICHSSEATLLDDEKYLAGGWVFKNSNGEEVAPDITQSDVGGIGSWSEEEIVQYLKSGSAPGGGESDSDFCPVGFYQNALPEDLIAIAKYLKTVPANK